MKYVGAAEFKANCLKLMAEVQAGGEPITVTKRGKPLATVGPVAEERPDPDSVFGCLKGTATWASDDDLIRPVTDKAWNAELDKWEPEP